MLTFKALSALLSYPTDEMHAALPEIADVIRNSPLIPPPQQRDLLHLIDEIGRGDRLAAEERYVDLFDRGRALSLHLFEHLHGDSRDRGNAMVELKQLYKSAGFELTAPELPDYLPVILEYLSCRDMTEAHDMLSDCAHILAGIGRSLLARQSSYAAVLQALIVIAGETPLDPGKIPAVKERLEAIDHNWAERPAFEDVGAARPDVTKAEARSC